MSVTSVIIRHIIILDYSSQLFSGSSDSVIKVWNIKSLKEITSFQAHTDPVCTLACNESYLFSGSLRSIKVSISGLMVSCMGLFHTKKLV